MGRDGGRLLGCEAISHARLHHEAAAARLLARPGCKLARVMALQAIHGGGGMRRVRDEEEPPWPEEPEEPATAAAAASVASASSASQSSAAASSMASGGRAGKLATRC